MSAKNEKGAFGASDKDVEADEQGKNPTEKTRMKEEAEDEQAGNQAELEYAPSMEDNEMGVAPTEVVRDDTGVSEVLEQQTDFFPETNQGQELNMDMADEVVMVNTEQDMDQDLEYGNEMEGTQHDVPYDGEDIFSAYLAPDPDEARRRALEDAVSAVNVRVVSDRRREKRKSWAPLLAIVALLLVAAAIGISLGITQSRKRNNKKATTSPAPTQAPTTTRFGQVAMLVESLFNTTTLDDARYQAAEWMAHTDMAFPDLATANPDHFQQRYALVVFYYATGGPSSWIESSFFLQPDLHECDWFEPAPPNTHSWSGSIGVYNCTPEQWVQGLEFNQNNLTGTLPEELGSLSAVLNFTVLANSIGGTLPPALFQMSLLRTFVVWSNELTGTIPTEIGRATSMLFFGLHWNQLTGSIPSELGALVNVQQVSLGSNFLTGTIPETLSKLSAVDLIDFGENALTGTLPSLLFTKCLNLQSFGAVNNLLSGTIPNNLGNLSLLDNMQLGENRFTGPFPSSVATLTNVTGFSVGENLLTGALPKDWSKLSQKLKLLYVGNNWLTGTLPESLGSLTLLEQIELQNNKIEGTIPESFGNLTMMQSLGLDTNGLTGTVPTSFVRFTSLRQLGLYWNKLTGDLSFLCNGNETIFPHVFFLGADCLEEVECPCCNMCCASNNKCTRKQIMNKS